MEDYPTLSAPEIFFVADTHFMSRTQPGESERRESFIKFIRKIPSNAAVIMLGDIFDFYFEYPSSVPKRYFDIFNAFYECRQRGVQAHFLGGNHDYWTKDFFQNELGVAIYKEKICIASQGRKIICVHGDIYMPGDFGYKIFRAVIQNRFVIAAAGFLHPDLLNIIASAISNRSKSHQKGSHEAVARALGNASSKKFFNHGNDVFIMGHIHYPLHINNKGKDFLILGGWFEHFTYGKLSDGKLTLETFKS